MKFNILVSEGPYTHQASDSAYHFAKAAVECGHQVIRVFFYHDGVHNATRLATPPSDEQDVVARWVRFAKDNDIDLAICIAASLRRGVLGPGSAQLAGQTAVNLDENFKVAGFGHFIEGAIAADRTVVFGD